MTQFGMSGRSLSRRLGKSPDYVQKRLDGVFEFTLSDIENFALFIGMNPEEFVGSIDRRALEKEIPVRPSTPIEARTLGEIIAGGKDAPKTAGEWMEKAFGPREEPSSTEKRIARELDLLPREVMDFSYSLWSERVDSLIRQDVGPDARPSEVEASIAHWTAELRGFIPRERAQRARRLTTGDVGGGGEDLARLDEEEIRERYGLAAGTDESAKRIHPETQ
jgi:hypothetical protein